MNETLRQRRTRLRLEVLELDKQLARPGHRINPETERMYTLAEYTAWRQRQVMAKADRARQLVEIREQLGNAANFWQAQAGLLRQCLVDIEAWSRKDFHGVVHRLAQEQLDRYADACAEHKKEES